MELNQRHFYEFGPFRLDPAERLLVRGNESVSLPPKAFELLVYLVTHHGRLITKNQILENVWAGSFVEESNLTVSISALRRALCEKEGGVRYIETVTKVGYRFIAHVAESEASLPIGLAAGAEAHSAALPSDLENGAAAKSALPVVAPETQDRARTKYELLASGGRTASQTHEASPRTGRRVLLFVLAMVVLGGAGYRLLRRSTEANSPRSPHSLAVLPFQNLTHDPNSDYLGFSLADAVITRLGSVGALTVRPSSAVEPYRNEAIDIQKVGRKLKVDTLLTANMIREGDDLRITPQLIDVRNNRILWKGTVDVKYENLLTVQDKVAQEIVKGLSLNLTPSEAQRLSANAPSNPLAYEYYLRGVDLYSRADFPMAIKMLEKSVEIDPKYALTWAQIGRAYTTQASLQFGGRDQYSKAQAAYEKSLALDPSLVETRIYMANLLTDTGRVEQAVPLLRDALASNANNAELHWELGYAYRFGGMLHESVEECELARRLDPGVKVTTSAVNAYLYLGQYDKFLDSLPQGNTIPYIVFYRGFGEYYKNNFDRAGEDFDRAYDLDPSLLQAQIGKALRYAIDKHDDQGLVLLRTAERKIAALGVGDPEAMYKLAQAYAALGDTAAAINTLRLSISNGFFPYPYFQSDPLLDPLRNEPQFAELMQISRQRHEAFQRKFFNSGK